MRAIRQAYPYTIQGTPPTTLFVTIEQVRAFLRLSDTEPTDDELELYIKAAQMAIERFTRLTLFNTNFLTKRDYFQDEIVLRRAPLNSVTKFERQVNDVLEEISPSVYKSIDELQINYGSIVLKANQYWPCDLDDERRGIHINFVAGFGTSADDLPSDLVMGGLRLIADLYENRGDCSCDGALAAMSPEATALLAHFKIREV